MSLRKVLIALSFIVALVAAAAADPVLRWSPSDAVISPGDEITLSVILDDTLEVRTIELYVQFDPAVIATVEGAPGDLFAGFNLFSGFEPETADTWHGYAVIMGSDEWTVGPGELWSWTVSGLAPGTSPLLTVSLVLLPPGGGDYTEVLLTDDQITVFDPTAALDLAPAVPRVGIYPNPFNPRTRVELLLPGGGQGRLEVLDMRGRVVDMPWTGRLAETAVSVDWDGRDRGGAPLPSGVYTFCLIGANGLVVSERGVLVR